MCRYQRSQRSRRQFVQCGGARAYLWRDGVTSEIKLGLTGSTGGYAVALNDSTFIVGWTGRGQNNQPRAVIWHNGTALDLTTQIDASDPLKRYVKPQTPVDINEIGEIVAYGVDTRTGRYGTYFLRPMHVLNINP